VEEVMGSFAKQLWGMDVVGFTDKFLSVDEVMEQSGLDFHVEAEPVFCADGTRVPKTKVTRNTRTGEIYGTVGDKYTILDNPDAFGFFQSFIDNKVAYIDCVGTLKKGAISFIQAKVCADPVEIIKGDAVESYITLLNSFAGLTAVNAGFFPRRIFCDNQMPALKSSKHLRVKHTKNVTLSLEAIQKIMDATNQEFLATTEQYKFLASKGVNKADLRKYITLVLQKDNEEDKELRESRVERIEYLFENGRGASEATHNFYGAFNAINESLNHEVGRSADSRLQSLWIGANANMNQRAFDVALQLAQTTVR
jgi:phage/plasmid-like protein (TIGR03299 family)